MSSQKVTLEEVVRESRDLLDPELVGARVDWSKVDAQLFARIGTEAKTQGALVKFAGRRSWGAVAAVLAVAAALPLMFAHSSSNTGAMPLEDAVARESRASLSAGAFAWKEGAGDVHIGADKIVASAGSALVRGDSVETQRARGIFERTVDGQRALTWALEDASHVTVKGTRGALVLGLDRGALEAQVTPVPSGEAFAVDVDAVRVAVHGTHLRVSREGTHVVVDLTEGIVSIGAPPRVGSTYGELVNAPAHIEFDANDVQGTLKVTHAPDRVRAALAFRPPAETVVTVTPRAQIAPPPSITPASPIAANHASGVTPVSPAPSAPKPESQATQPSEGQARTQGANAQPANAEGGNASIATRGDAHPEKTIIDAIRSCARANASAHPDDVVITVTSKLELRVGAAGSVESARFVPPLNPEVQSCASSVIYKTHFAEPGPITIPLDFQR